MTYHCRICGQPLAIEIPSDAVMGRCLTSLATKACCNRCADYKRGQRDRADAVQKLALSLGNAPSDSVPNIRRAIEAILNRVVQVAEDHYLLSGLMADAPEFVATVFERPAYAAYFVRQFDLGAAAIARDTHRRVAA